MLHCIGNGMRIKWRVHFFRIFVYIIVLRLLQAAFLWFCFFFLLYGFFLLMKKLRQFCMPSRTDNNSRLLSRMERTLFIISASSNISFWTFSSPKCSCHAAIFFSVFWISSKTRCSFLFMFTTSVSVIKYHCHCSCVIIRLYCHSETAVCLQLKLIISGTIFTIMFDKIPFGFIRHKSKAALKRNHTKILFASRYAL